MCKRASRKMEIPNPSTNTLLSILFYTLICFNLCQVNDGREIHNLSSFVQCLYFSPNSTSISTLVYTPSNSSYSSALNSTIQNLRFSTPWTPKPTLIVIPSHVSHVQAAITCSKDHGFEVRVRSGGHDYEGLSFVSHVPFVILDMSNLGQVSVDEGNMSAWVEAGATIGELYYRVAEKSSTLGFPAGLCSTIGVGGHLSGGGYGTLLRKYGLAADHIIDAQLVDVRGRLLDRQSMGEDLFWAIRGGGGASFGVIVGWKVKLVPVPSIVTVFTIQRTSEQNVTNLVHQWQHKAHKFDDDLFIRIIINTINSTERGRQRTVQASFNSMLLGRTNELLELMQEGFPDLGLVREDCIEMSWIESVLYFAGYPREQSPEVLLKREPLIRVFFKAKSDYVQEPIPETGLEAIWERFYEEGGETGQMILVPYGGKMSEISETQIPFPHRAGNLYQIQHFVYWLEDGAEVADKCVRWIRRLYSFMGAYVSKNPRQAYVNYRDVDIGVNFESKISYEQSSIWGVKYFKNNFNRLVLVKTQVDPANFFKNEQSIPPL